MKVKIVYNNRSGCLRICKTHLKNNDKLGETATLGGTAPCAENYTRYTIDDTSTYKIDNTTSPCNKGGWYPGNNQWTCNVWCASPPNPIYGGMGVAYNNGHTKGLQTLSNWGYSDSINFGGPGPSDTPTKCLCVAPAPTPPPTPAPTAPPCLKYDEMCGEHAKIFPDKTCCPGLKCRTLPKQYGRYYCKEAN